MERETYGLVVLHQKLGEGLMGTHEGKDVERIHTGDKGRGNESDEQNQRFLVHPFHATDDGIEKESVGIEHKQLADEVEQCMQERMPRQLLQDKEQEGISGYDQDVDLVEHAKAPIMLCDGKQLFKEEEKRDEQGVGDECHSVVGKV
ncbi:hypothetical protein SDC9_186645 [bioreactor metagenome]|uniref:Uncharacterized protein n=1 Tax=bioreactor metagenome TaxID=1076179 RepID=A0A645HJC9_9ZZZZ